MWSYRLVFASALCAAAVFLASCGGGSEAESPPESSPAVATTAVAAEPGTTAEETTEPAPPATTGPPATTAEPPEPEAPPRPLPGLPRYTAGYETWTQLNPDPIPPADSDPHLGTKDVFANWEADRSGGSLVYPDGTIVVKQAFRPGKDFIGLIAIMRKEQGVNPEHSDWVFVEYTRDSPDERFRELASGSVCSSCHMGAAATDYVWVHTTGAAR